MQARLDVRDVVLARDVEVRRLDDGTNGAVHLPRTSSAEVGADLVLQAGETVLLPLGAADRRLRIQQVGAR